jgi:STE24 endopeptidase
MEQMDLTASDTPAPRPQLHVSEETRRYHRQKRTLHIAEIGVSLVYWLMWCAAGAAFVNLVGEATGSRWLTLAISALAMLGGMVLVNLPLDYYGGYTLEQRYGLSNQTPRAWLVFQVKSWLIGAILGAVIIGGLYALLWYGGRFWSVMLWAGVMLLSVGLAKVFPLLILPLFYPARPLDRPSLTQRFEQMAQGTGLTIRGVFDLALSKDTKKANAMLTGLGSSRRVYLSDTLLEAFDDDQIAVVFAHELGHHIRGHIYKGIAITAVVTSLLVAIIHWRLSPVAGASGDWQRAIALLLAPVTNAISRHFERQCDSDALRLTDDPDAYRRAFIRLAEMNMADPNPPRWEEILFDDHPAMVKRLAMADAYEHARSA